MAHMLALDFGLKRIGVAVGDEETNMIFPREAVAFITMEESVAEIAQLVASENIAIILVGHPVNLQGQETEQTRRTTVFAQTLQKAVNVPVITVDERYTTKVAGAKMRLQGMNEKQQRGLKDSIAAAVMLEGWLAQK